MKYRKTMEQVLCAGALVCALAGMATGQAPAGQTAAPADGAQAKPAAGSEALSAAVDPNTYKIGAEDVIRVTVWREPELSGAMIVRPDGKVTLPLIGDVQAAGLTPVQMSQQVKESLGKILNKPEVMIAVQSVNSKRFYISGKVGRGGPVPLVMPTTVLQALSSAGLSEWAKKKKIVIMRGTERLKFNYEDVIQGKRLEQNIYLQDGDHIYVP
jgi:polysaccharide export outer membrane protein